MGWRLAIWGDALYGQVTGKLMLAARGTLMVDEQGRMMMAEAERAARVDCGRGRASGES